MRIHMCDQFIAFLGGSVEANGKIYIIPFRERYLLISTVDRTRRSKNEMGDLLFASLLDQVHEANHVALHIEMRVLEGVVHSGLRRQVNHWTELVLLEEFPDT